MMIYFVRHAESLPRSGMTEIEGKKVGLSTLGEEQAKDLAKRLRNKGVTRVITSDFTRAKQTGEIIGGVLSVPTTEDKRLGEWNPAPELTHSALAAVVSGARATSGQNATGETFDNSVARMEEFLTETVNRESENVCIVSHELILQNIFMKLFNLKNPPALALASITTLSYESGSYVLVRINTKGMFWRRICKRIIRLFN